MNNSPGSESLLTQPIFPTLHELLTYGSTDDFWSRPLLPPELEELLLAEEKHHAARHSALESLDERKLMAADVSFAAETLFVKSNDESDDIVFTAGTDFHQLTINGETLQIPASAIQQARFYGGSEDSIQLDGQQGSADRFTIKKERAILKSDGINARAYGFGTVGSQGQDANDKAYLTGSDGEDALVGGPDGVTFELSTGNSYTAEGYGRVYVNAEDGADSLKLEDSPGDDKYKSNQRIDILATPDAYMKMVDFEDVEIEAKNGGHDKAYQRGTNDDDLLILTEDSMMLKSESKEVDACGFDRSFAWAGKGEDTVRAYDAIFTETFEFESAFESAGERNSLDGRKNIVRLYSNDFYRRAQGFELEEAIRVSPERMAGSYSEAGAVSINQDYENGLRSDFYIEQQRRGAELIESGLATKHVGLTEAGIKMIQWGLDQQAADGSFPDCDDAVHSTTMFMRAVGHALIKFEEIEFDGFTPEMREEWTDGLVRMSDWVIANQDLRPDLNLEPFSHRYFLRAIAFRQVHTLTEISRFDGQARAYFDEAVDRLNMAPLLVEAGGFDLSYQCFGLRLASDYHEITEDSNSKAAIKNLFRGSFRAIDSRISDEGIADMSDSSRANETCRTGRTKTFDYRNAIHAFLSGARILGSQDYLDLAERTFNGSRS